MWSTHQSNAGMYGEDLVVIQNDLRVGLVGANANAGWAKMSHIPAINGLTGLKLAAVATRNEQIARHAAEAFGAGSRI